MRELTPTELLLVTILVTSLVAGTFYLMGFLRGAEGIQKYAWAHCTLTGEVESKVLTCE